jgi:cobalt/nickel transport system ATP-binding protein
MTGEDGVVSAIFRVNGLSYSYPSGQPALQDVNLSIDPGEQLVILGANGCGKSTLLKALDGLLAPASGQILAFGEDVTGAAGDPELGRWLHRRVGLVFQDPEVQLFSPTVFDDVAFGPLQLGWSEEEVIDAVNAALRDLGIEHLADRAPYELSGGEKRRVAIATVLSMDPEVILLDEPTANLDPRSRSALIEIIARLRDRGKTIVLTTHDLDLVPLLATRVIVFGDQERQPVASGSPDEILADTDLLLRANLIHEHLHYHGALVHSHIHAHRSDHQHRHEHATERSS